MTPTSAIVLPTSDYHGTITTAIFDWAGTVLDFGCIAPVKAFRQVFAEVGVPISELEARAPMGAAKRDHIVQILAMPSVQGRWIAARGAASSQSDVDTLYARFLGVDERNVKEHSALIPGALETIDALRSRAIRIGSTTGYPRQVMDKLIPLAATQGYRPDHCCTASDVARGRPFPDMCLNNALALGATHMRACVVVDDSPTGIQSGRAAGMWTVGISATGNEVGLGLAAWQGLDPQARAARVAPARARLADSGAHFVIESIADLLPVIESIEAHQREGVFA